MAFKRESPAVRSRRTTRGRVHAAVTAGGAPGKGLIRSASRQGVRSDMRPPVVRRRRALREPTLCERCGAVYAHKTWRTGEFAVRADPAGAFWTVCPACEQLGTGEYFGRVIIRGVFAAAHERAIRDRIRGVAARARYTQPMRRVISFERRGGMLELLTTSQKLAHRVARQLKRTFGGTVTYAWSDRDGELYATWQREDLPVAPAAARRVRIKGRRAPGAGADLEIQARHIALDPAWRDLIERSVARLCERHPEVIRVHVTLTHSAHHRHGLEEVTLTAKLPRGPLRAAKREEDVPAAIRAAFAALARELERGRRGRRRSRGRPWPSPEADGNGHVARAEPLAEERSTPRE